MDDRIDGLGFVLGDIHRGMRRAFEKRVGDSGMTMAQARVLAHIFRRQGLRQVELADTLEVQPMSLTRLLDQLVEQGLIERRADPADRRAYQLFLTPQAQPRLDALDAVVQDVYADVLRGISEKQMATTLKALRQIRDNLSAL